jgi:hypothetical protein
MRKYGISNFEIKILDMAKSFDELKQKECEYILNYKSYDESIGYNMSIDTEDGLELLSEESKIKRSHSIHVAHASKNKAKHGRGIRKYKNIYYASIVFNGKVYSLHCDSLEEARIAYDKIAIYFHGECASVYNKKIYTQEEIEDNYKKFKNVLEKPTSSRYFGVSKTRNNKLASYINKDKKTYFLGHFEDEALAAKTVDRARCYLYGKNSKKYNFPQDVDSYLSDPILLKKWFLSIIENRSRGINHDKRINKWGVLIFNEGKRIGLGYYSDREQAAKIRDMGILYFNLNEPLNYPEEKEDLSKNCQIIIPAYLSSKNKYTGVYNENGKYGSRIIFKKKLIKLGWYTTEEDAAKAYDKKAIELLGDKAKLNFPDNGIKIHPFSV